MNADCRVQWQKLFRGLRERMKQRGLERAMMLGWFTDVRAQQGELQFWSEVTGDLPWVSHAHFKIGKGTGKYAETYRRDARKYMQQCRNAIPAWIMPLYRVAEQVEAEPEIFDVVIVDESSQTGPEGLILQYLAKQCVIVGDDKQISPEGGFVEGDHVVIDHEDGRVIFRNHQ